MANSKLATKYSATAVKVSSFDACIDLVSSTYVDNVKNLPLPSFNVIGKDGSFVAPRFNGLFLCDSDGIPVAPVGDSSVSPNYVPHTNEHVSRCLEACRQAFGGELSVDCLWRDGHVLVVMPTFESVAAIGGNPKDIIIPRLAIYGGYAGKPFHASFGFHRPVCLNLMILNLVEGISQTIRHTLSLGDRMERLIEQFQTLRATWQETVAQAERMQQREVSVKEFLREFYKTDERQNKTNALENRIEKIVSRLYREQQELGLGLSKDTTNAWMLFNAVQGAFQHDFTRKETDKTLRGLDTWNNADLVRAERILMGV